MRRKRGSVVRVGLPVVVGALALGAWAFVGSGHGSFGPDGEGAGPEAAAAEGGEGSGHNNAAGEGGSGTGHENAAEER